MATGTVAPLDTAVALLPDLGGGWPAGVPMENTPANLSGASPGSLNPSAPDEEHSPGPHGLFVVRARERGGGRGYQEDQGESDGAHGDTACKAGKKTPAPAEHQRRGRRKPRYFAHMVPVVHAAPKAPAMAASEPAAAVNQPATPAMSATGYLLAGYLSRSSVLLLSLP